MKIIVGKSQFIGIDASNNECLLYCAFQSIYWNAFFIGEMNET